MSAGIDLENVCCDFGSFRAVDNANVSIKPGEFFSFLGPSGCGKTTILRMISGFTEPTEGAIRVATVERGEVRTKWWHDEPLSYRDVAIVGPAQHHRLPDHPLPADYAGAPVDGPPVFIGHYWRVFSKYRVGL